MSAYLDDPAIRAKLKELTEKELAARRLDFDDLNSIHRYQIRSEVSNALATELVDADLIGIDDYESAASEFYWALRHTGI